MTKGIIRTLMAAAVGLVCLGGRSANALTVWHSPWGDANANAYIGSDSVGTQYIIWVLRPNVSGLEFSMIGDANGLWDDVEVHAGAGNDGILLMHDGYTTEFGTFNSLRYAGHYLDIYGGPGVDGLSTYIGDTWAFGEEGDDDIYSLNLTGRLYGWTGNDTLITGRLLGTDDYVYGDDGDDCLEDASQSAIVYDCGAGNDSSTNRGTPANAQSCEQRVDSCPARWKEVCSDPNC